MSDNYYEYGSIMSNIIADNTNAYERSMMGGDQRAEKMKAILEPIGAEILKESLKPALMTISKTVGEKLGLTGLQDFAKDVGERGFGKAIGKRVVDAMTSRAKAAVQQATDTAQGVVDDATSQATSLMNQASGAVDDATNLISGDGDTELMGALLKNPPVNGLNPVQAHNIASDPEKFNAKYKENNPETTKSDAEIEQRRQDWIEKKKQSADDDDNEADEPEPELDDAIDETSDVVEDTVSQAVPSTGDLFSTFSGGLEDDPEGLVSQGSQFFSGISNTVAPEASGQGYSMLARVLNLQRKKVATQEPEPEDDEDEDDDIAGNRDIFNDDLNPIRSRSINENEDFPQRGRRLQQEEQDQKAEQTKEVQEAENPEEGRVSGENQSGSQAVEEPTEQPATSGESQIGSEATNAEEALAEGGESIGKDVAKDAVETVGKTLAKEAAPEALEGAGLGLADALGPLALVGGLLAILGGAGVFKKHHNPVAPTPLNASVQFGA